LLKVKTLHHGTADPPDSDDPAEPIDSIDDSGPNTPDNWDTSGAHPCSHQCSKVSGSIPASI